MHYEKRCEFKVAAKKWLWWKANGKNFNNDNSGKLPSHISLGFSTELSLLKFFAISLPSQLFLGDHLGFHIIFRNRGPHFFTTWLIFFASFCKCIMWSWKIAIINVCYSYLQHCGEFYCTMCMYILYKT